MSLLLPVFGELRSHRYLKVHQNLFGGRIVLLAAAVSRDSPKTTLKAIINFRKVGWLNKSGM